MKIQEVSEHCNVTTTTLRYYESIGLLNTVKRVNGIREYQKEDIQQINDILTLKHAGLTTQQIKQYLSLLPQGKGSLKQRVGLLQKQRNILLDTIHQQQKQIDYLDYITYDIQQG